MLDIRLYCGRAFSAVNTYAFTEAVRSPRVGIILSSFAIYPFISTVTGTSIFMFGMFFWKALSICWGASVVFLMYRDRRVFGRVTAREALVYLFLLLSLLFAPRADMLIDPAKGIFFIAVVAVYIRTLAVMSVCEVQAAMAMLAAGWVAFAGMLLGYALYRGNYPGSIQHQFFLSGYLGFIAALRIIMESKYARAGGEGPGLFGNRVVNWGFMALATANVAMNLEITYARSVFPFSVALLFLAYAWTAKSGRGMRGMHRRLGVPLGIILSFSPILHLSGLMGNLVNEVTYPIFGKIRSVDSATGREVAFRKWAEYLEDNARLVGKAYGKVPEVKMVDEPEGAYRDPRRARQLRELQEYVADRKKIAIFGGVSNEKPLPRYLAITSPHNLWLDATGRAGILYAASILFAFSFMLWLACESPADLRTRHISTALWLLLVCWGVATQLDDEHWFYHIPYLSLFFIGLLVPFLGGRSSRGEC